MDGQPRRPALIAEIADNHGGDIRLAKEFIRILGAIGVDYVKFQSWQLRKVRDPAAEPKYEWLETAELSDDDHVELIHECENQGVRFLTTAFDPERIGFLSSLGMHEVKIGSGEVSDHDLLRAARKAFPHVICSTGMHTADEVGEAAEILREGEFTFMHCVSVYPHSLDRANLSRMEWLRQFTPSVGYSDHSSSLDAARMALVLGARFVERHTALGKYGPGRVNPWDTLPEQWDELVRFRDGFVAAWGPGVETTFSDEELAARRRFIGRWKGKPM